MLRLKHDVHIPRAYPARKESRMVVFCLTIRHRNILIVSYILVQYIVTKLFPLSVKQTNPVNVQG